MFNKKAKEYQEKYREAHREQANKSQGKWRLAHPEGEKAKSKKYRMAHSDQEKVRGKKYRLTHIEETKERHKKYQETHPEAGEKHYLAHCEEIKERSKKWQLAHPNKMKEIRRRMKAKRRQLGFVPLNKMFPGAHGHHVDTERVIYMPAKLHGSIKHSVLANRNMDKINEIAFKFL